MTASTPWACSHSASSTVVAEDRMRAPVARTRASSGAAGKPKWKLTTAGLNSSTSAAVASPKGARDAPATAANGSRPSSTA